jgi:hypothetical protein
MSGKTAFFLPRIGKSIGRARFPFCRQNRKRHDAARLRRGGGGA